MQNLRISFWKGSVAETKAFYLDMPKLVVCCNSWLHFKEDIIGCCYIFFFLVVLAEVSIWTPEPSGISGVRCRCQETVAKHHQVDSFVVQLSSPGNSRWGQRLSNFIDLLGNSLTRNRAGGSCTRAEKSWKQQIHTVQMYFFLLLTLNHECHLKLTNAPSIQNIVNVVLY